MFFRYNLFGIIWGSMIFVLSVMPGEDLPETEIVNFDVICHVLFYALLVLLLIVGFVKQYDYGILRSYPVITAVLAGTVYGLLIETIQHYYCAGRHFDIKDILANFIGVIAGVVLFKAIYYKYLTN